MLAGQNNGYFRGQTAQDLIIGIDNIPVALDILFLKNFRFH
jgi:hypothetical protein